MYIHRHLESILEKASKMFGAVLVTGPRQVGKTTLLRRFANSANYISLDDPMQLHAAVEQPATFFKDNTPPVFVDEIQYGFRCVSISRLNLMMHFCQLKSILLHAKRN